MALTEEQAILLAKTKFWQQMSHHQRARFQLFESRLCMPFDIFHEAIERALGRPVWTHEFGLNLRGLQEELLGEGHTPTMDEIIALIPEDKRIIINPNKEDSP